MRGNCDVFGQHSVPSEALGNEALRKRDASLQCRIPLMKVTSSQMILSRSLRQMSCKKLIV